MKQTSSVIMCATYGHTNYTWDRHSLFYRQLRLFTFYAITEILTQNVVDTEAA